MSNKFSQAAERLGAKEEQPELPLELPVVKAPAKVPTKAPVKAKRKLPRTRKNHKGVLAYVPLSVHKALGQMCLDQDRNKNELLNEAIELLFKEHGVHPRD